MARSLTSWFFRCVWYGCVCAGGVICTGRCSRPRAVRACWGSRAVVSGVVWLVPHVSFVNELNFFPRLSLSLVCVRTKMLTHAAIREREWVRVRERGLRSDVLLHTRPQAQRCSRRCFALTRSGVRAHSRALAYREPEIRDQRSEQREESVVVVDIFLYTSYHVHRTFTYCDPADTGA